MFAKSSKFVTATFLKFNYDKNYYTTTNNNMIIIFLVVHDGK